MESMNEKLIAQLKANVAAIEALEKTGDEKAIEELNKKTVDELKAAIAKMEAFEAARYWREQAEAQKNKAIEAAVGLMYVIDYWEEADEKLREIAYQFDIRPEDIDAEKPVDAEILVLRDAVLPWVQKRNAERPVADDEVPF